MTTTYLLELFRDIHNAESDRHEKLNGHLSLPTAIVTVLGGVLAFYLDKFSGCAKPAEGWSNMQMFFILCLWIFFAAIGAAILFLVLSLFHYSYRYISDANDIHDYVMNMEAWYITIGAQQIPQKVDDDVRELMTEQYIQCAVHNRMRNSLKAKHLYLAKASIVVALMVMALSIYPFYSSIKSIETIHKVQLVDKEKQNGR